METWTGSWPGSHFFSLAAWLTLAAYTLHSARAEITCASCPSPVQLHLENLQLGTHAQATEEPGVPQNIRVEFREVELPEQSVEAGGAREGRESVGRVPGSLRDVSLDGVGENENAARSSAQSQRFAAEEWRPAKGDGGGDAAPRRARRSPAQFPELAENGWTGVDAGAVEERGSLLDGQRQGRSEYRWNREDGRGNNRQDEPKISSSTFALTGDSAHNHAVVYWSGQNSSVSNSTTLPSTLTLLLLLPPPPPPPPYHRSVRDSRGTKLRHARSGDSLPLRCAAANRCTGIHRCAPRRAALRMPHLCSHCELCSSADLRAQPANYARKLMSVRPGDSESSLVTFARVFA